MKRPKEVGEIVAALAINTVPFIIAGPYFLWRYYFSQPPSGGDFLLGVGLILFGIPLTIITTGFFLLQPWTYPIVKQLVGGGPIGIRGSGAYFKSKMTTPEMLHTFGQKVEERKNEAK